MSLLLLQKNFANHLYKKSDKKILSTISCLEVEAQARLKIYRSNVLGNFESVLSATFPVIKKILGEKKFAKICHKYCQKFPSKSGDLNEFGGNFSQFIKLAKPLYLKDLARLELAFHQSYFVAKITKKFDLKRLQKLLEKDFTNLTFKLDPSCILVASKFAIFSIWKKERKIKNFSKEELSLVYANKILLLSEEEFLFLSLIQKQKKLYEIYKSICRKTKKDCDIGALLNRFITSGVIVEFKIHTLS